MPSTAVLEMKKQQVAALSDRIKNSCAGVVVDYKGITVSDDTQLRHELREAGVHYTVVKNTLLGRAAEAAGLEGLESVLALDEVIALSKLPSREAMLSQIASLVVEPIACIARAVAALEEKGGATPVAAEAEEAPAEAAPAEEAPAEETAE